jgi:hypothetical protein
MVEPRGGYTIILKSFRNSMLGDFFCRAACPILRRFEGAMGETKKSGHQKVTAKVPAIMASGASRRPALQGLQNNQRVLKDQVACQCSMVFLREVNLPEHWQPQFPAGHCLSYPEVPGGVA